MSLLCLGHHFCLRTNSSSWVDAWNAMLDLVSTFGKTLHSILLPGVTLQGFGECGWVVRYQLVDMSFVIMFLPKQNYSLPQTWPNHPSSVTVSQCLVCFVKFQMLTHHTCLFNQLFDSLSVFLSLLAMHLGVELWSKHQDKQKAMEKQQSKRLCTHQWSKRFGVYLLMLLPPRFFTSTLTIFPHNGDWDFAKRSELFCTCFELILLPCQKLHQMVLEA